MSEVKAIVFEHAINFAIPKQTELGVDPLVHLSSLFPFVYTATNGHTDRRARWNERYQLLTSVLETICTRIRKAYSEQKALSVDSGKTSVFGTFYSQDENSFRYQFGEPLKTALTKLIGNNGDVQMSIDVWTTARDEFSASVNKHRERLSRAAQTFICEYLELLLYPTTLKTSLGHMDDEKISVCQRITERWFAACQERSLNGHHALCTILTNAGIQRDSYFAFSHSHDVTHAVTALKTNTPALARFFIEMAEQLIKADAF